MGLEVRRARDTFLNLYGFGRLQGHQTLLKLYWFGGLQGLKSLLKFHGFWGVVGPPNPIDIVRARRITSPQPLLKLDWLGGLQDCRAPETLLQLYGLGALHSHQTLLKLCCSG